MSGNTPDPICCDFCDYVADEVTDDGFGVCRRCHEYSLRPGMTVSDAIEALAFCASMKGVEIAKMVRAHRPLARWFRQQSRGS